jgi:hypothetical protein
MAPGISTGAISMAIGFDPTKLQCISSVSSLNSNISTGFLSNCGVFSGASQFRAAWFNLTPVAFNGLMFNVRFKILAAGSHSLQWDLATPGNCEYADGLADVIPNIEWLNGTVNADNQTIGNPPGSGCGLSLITGSWTANQFVGVNSSVNNILYQTSGATGAVISGLPLGVTGSWSNNLVTISGTPLVQGTFNYSITLTGGICAGGNDTQSVCVNQPLDEIQYTTTGATGAAVTGLPSGVTGVWSGNKVIISGTPTVTGDFAYTVTMSGGCVGPNNSVSGLISVQPLNTVALTSGSVNQSLCINNQV